MKFERAILEATYPNEGSNVSAGLEVLDGERLAGVAVSVQPNGSLRWRSMEEGVWGNWRSFPRQFPLGKIKI